MIGIESVSVESMADRMNSGEFEGVFTASERKYCDGKARPYESYAGLFCAKSAVVKAAGSNARLCISDIEILHRDNGAPYANVRGEAARFLSDKTVSVSVSHDGGRAVAVATVCNTDGGIGL